jgi:hypothetical protein
MHGVVLTLLLLGAGPAELKAGVARKPITPREPIRMAGFFGRVRPSQGVLHDLWAKALALEDARGSRVVIVAIDLIELPREVSDEVAVRAERKYGLRRQQLMLNCSHTHSGPLILPSPIIEPDLSPRERQVLVDYRNRLIDDLVEVVGGAIGDLRPATLAVGHGSAPFVMNRRERTPKGLKLGVNPHGPVDRDVPVLRIATPQGKPRVVLFGYACHNTTLGGDQFQICGDYAGFAQIEVEKALPGATAMFLQLCGADADPYPRCTLQIAGQHGKTLAAAVERALRAPLKTVHPAIRTACEMVKLDLAHQDRATFVRELGAKEDYRRRRAAAMLAALDAGRPIWQVPVPVQVVGFGDHLAMVAMGGEVVVDYALRLKREYPGTDLVVAGYTHDVRCYIPSHRMLAEGGYEVVSSMALYCQPGPFAENVEESLIGSCRRLLAKIDVTNSRGLTAPGASPATAGPRCVN